MPPTINHPGDSTLLLPSFDFSELLQGDSVRVTIHGFLGRRYRRKPVADTSVAEPYLQIC
jgi:hypothetical protein